MIFALLEYGTVWFWLATIIPFLLLILFVETEKSASAIFTIILTFAAFVAFGDKGIIPWIQHNPLAIAEYAGVYVVAGIIWGFVKWFFYVLKIRDRYAAFRKNWIATHGDIDDAPYTDGYGKKGSTRKIVFQNEARVQHVIPPSADKNKGRIIFWMTYWPASAVWTLLNDPITRLWKFVYNRLGALFERISKAMFSKYANDFED